MSSYKDLDAFVADLNQVIKEYPYEAETKLVRIGNKTKKILKEKSPDSGQGLSKFGLLKMKVKRERGFKGRKVKAASKQLKNRWKSEITGIGSDMQVDIWTTAPHFHLVDRGHIQKDAHGNVKGFVQGKHFLATTVQEVEQNVVPEEMEKFFKQIKKKIEK